MSVSEPALDLFGQFDSLVDERTLDILERRRRAPVMHRRGWLIRRALLAADVIGLVGAFLATELLLGLAGHGGDLGAPAETVLFTVTLPIWVVVAKIYG